MSDGLVLDTGALLALERGDARVRALLRRVMDRDMVLAVPSGVIAQSWRGGRRQARMARLLADPAVRIPALDDITARAVGLLSGRSGHPDVIDVHVVLHARLHNFGVVSSDPNDLHRVDPRLEVIVV